MDKVSSDYLHVKQEGGGVIGDNGYICTVVAHLIERSLLKLHEYVRVFFISGVKIPVAILRLRGRVMDPLDSLSTFLL